MQLDTCNSRLTNQYTSYNQQISNISIDVGRNKGLAWEKEEFDEAEQTVS